ncbi:MAG: septum formation initiator family protein [Lachnospiraceae bacterium]|nr:septum formation initiator family protein [Lachnospiraceae bacterium]
MAKRKVAYRKRRQNGFGMFLVTLVLVMLLAVVCISGNDLRRKRDIYATKEAALASQIEEEQVRSEEIKEYEKYTKTKKYVEEVAKEKLGLVYPGEIVFVPEK